MCFFESELDYIIRASPSYQAYDEDGFKPPVRDKDSDDEGIPWWAEFDKTYEVEKKKLEEERSKLEEEERAVMSGKTKCTASVYGVVWTIFNGKLNFPAKETLPSVISTDEIDVIQCVMSLVEKARAQQDETIEAARDCINHIINKVSLRIRLPLFFQLLFRLNQHSWFVINKGPAGTVGND